MPPEYNTISPDVERIHQAWEKYRKYWWFTHYAIGITGVVASITVANNPSVLHNPSWLLNGISWLAALCIALITFLDAKKRARGYSAAWRILHLTIANYKYQPSGTPPDKLLLAIKDGEQIIAALDS
jgi:uncharacterized membrane protein YhaH (DUF805 family)